MNTRRHPRTIKEAFPKTAEYGCAIERPYKCSVWRRLGTIALLAVVALPMSVLLITKN